MCLIVDLSVEFLRPVPCEDVIFEGNVVYAGSKLIIVDGVCWNDKRTVKFATSRVCFNIYKNPQPVMHKIFAWIINTLGHPGPLLWLNPVFMMKVISFLNAKKR